MPQWNGPRVLGNVCRMPGAGSGSLGVARAVFHGGAGIYKGVGDMADGAPIIQGNPGWVTVGGARPLNETQSATRLISSATVNDGTGLYIFASGSAPGGGDGLYVVGQGASNKGVRAYCQDGDGVHGIGGAAGVHGSCMSADSASAGVIGDNPASVGVRGEGGPAGVFGEAADIGGFGVQGVHQAGVTDGIGVVGFARTGVWGDGSIGVIGQSRRDFGFGGEGDAAGEGGFGVYGAATAARGIGVYATAQAPTSAALQVNGRAVFSSSGRIVVPTGATSATQGGLSLAAASLVLAVLQQNLPGIAVRAAVPDTVTGSVTVQLTQAPPVDAAVAWIVLN